MLKLLLVEDDSSLGESLSLRFEHANYEVLRAQSVAAANELMDSSIQIVVLDLGLPDGDGLDLCRSIRTTYPSTQIIVLTARNQEVDVVLGLDAGADDYITKPFHLNELMARLRARVRSAPDPRNPRQIEVGRLMLDEGSRRIFLDGAELDLRQKEFDLLALLLSEAGSIVTRQRAMAQVWDQNWYGSTKTLDMHISSLRKKIDAVDADRSVITTLRGVGYRLELSD